MKELQKPSNPPMLRVGGRRSEPHKGYVNAPCTFLGRRSLLLITLLKKLTDLSFHNPTLSFGRFMHFRANRARTCRVLFLLAREEGRPGGKRGYVQQAARKSGAELGKEPGFLTPVLGLFAPSCCPWHAASPCYKLPPV